MHAVCSSNPYSEFNTQISSAAEQSGTGSIAVSNKVSVSRLYASNEDMLLKVRRFTGMLTEYSSPLTRMLLYYNKNNDNSNTSNVA